MLVHGALIIWFFVMFHFACTAAIVVGPKSTRGSESHQPPPFKPTGEFMIENGHAPGQSRVGTLWPVMDYYLLEWCTPDQSDWLRKFFFLFSYFTIYLFDLCKPPPPPPPTRKPPRRLWLNIMERESNGYGGGACTACLIHTGPGTKVKSNDCSDLAPVNNVVVSIRFGQCITINRWMRQCELAFHMLN